MTSKSSLTLMLLCVIAGLLGMALFEVSLTVYQDWAFVHRVRLLQELQQQQQPTRQAPAPSSTPSTPTTPSTPQAPPQK